MYAVNHFNCTELVKSRFRDIDVFFKKIKKLTKTDLVQNEWCVPEGLSVVGLNELAIFLSTSDMETRAITSVSVTYSFTFCLEKLINQVRGLDF